LSFADWKLRYWQKALSEDAIDACAARAADTFELARFRSDWVLSDTLLSTLTSTLLFDVPPSELVPWLLAWEVEVPAVDEFLRGVLIKLEPVDLAELFPELLDASKTVELLFEAEYSKPMEETRLRKCRYDESRFDESYFDPPAVRDFLRSTLYAFTKKDVSLPEARLRVEEAARRLGLPEELARDLFNRLSAVAAVKEGAATWDYAWWDRSSWSEEAPGGVVEFTTYDLAPARVEYEQLFDVQAGGLWDHSLWEYAFWSPDRPAYRLDVEAMKSYLDGCRDAVTSSFVRRYFATPLAVANYQTAAERLDWRSGRTEAYALPTSHRMAIESAAESAVKALEPDVDAFKLRLYKSAALDLYGTLYGVHRWGYEALRAMGAEELRAYWLAKWGREGLREDVLEALYGALRRTIDALGLERSRQRLRFLRERLGRLR